MRSHEKQPAQDKSVAIIGLGAIGSETAAQMIRAPEVSRLVLVDHDRYERKNLLSQAIEARDVGRLKAEAQARRALQRNPALAVEALADRVENVPLARLRCDVILACLDSRRARQVVNQAAWRLGVPWIDAGVHVGADGGLLARVNVYVPGLDQPCLECAWSDEDYALEQSYPCQGEAQAPAPTGSPPGLGALAAAMQVIEARKILAGQFDRAAVGRQVLIDAAWHRHYVTTYRRNPACRFDHETWRIEAGKLAESQALRLALGTGLGRETRGDMGFVGLRVEGETFVLRLACLRCGRTKELLHLGRRLPQHRRVCRHCGGEMVAAGSDMIGALRAEDVPARMLALPLRRIGLRAGDVVTATAGGRVAHFEIGRDGAVTHKRANG